MKTDLSPHQVPELESPRPRKRTNAFTLIEVVVAVGIVATVFVALMGMIPIGLGTLKDAGEITMRAQIGQKLIGELQLVEWRPDGGSGDQVILDYDGVQRFYDDFGNRVTSAGDAIYTAQMEVDPDPVTLPQSGPDGNVFMKKVTVKIAHTPPGVQVDFDDNVKSPNYARYSAFVSDLKVRGQDIR